MKVIAFNCSPNRDKGSTALILNPFLEGMKRQGAEIELIYISDLKIDPCRGCTDDLLFTPDGICKVEDDMQKLYPKLEEADYWVFATPNYLNNITSSLKNLLDRMEPLFEPPYESVNPNRPLRLKKEPGKRGKIVLLSTGGLWGMENFKLMVDQMQFVSEMFGRELCPPVLRPHSSALTALANLGKPAFDVYEAAIKAGEQLIESGSIAKETLDVISRELVSKDSFIQELALIVS